MEVESLTVELRALSTDALAQILDSLHDLKSPVCRNAIMAVFWERHAHELPGGWPVHELDILDPTNPDLIRPRVLGKHRVIRYCRASQGPQDALHKALLRLVVVTPSRTIVKVRCSCGREFDEYDLLRCQERGDHRVWPQVSLPDALTGVAAKHFQICRHAKHVQDPFHAPGPGGERCLCYSQLGIHHTDGEEDRFLPVF